MNCISCGNKDDTVPVDDYKIWTLYHCKDCNLHFWDPLDFDETQYRNRVKYSRYELFEIIEPYHHQALKVLQDNFKGIHGKLNILEIGCGNGSFLNMLTDKSGLNANYYGIDLNCHAIEFAKNNFGFGENVKCVDFLDESEFSSERLYDILIILEVLEHQTELHVFIDKLKKMLAPGGCIIGTVPNNDRYIPLGIREIWDYPPHHFTRWDSLSLRRLLSNHNFQTIEIMSCNHWSISRLSNHIQSLLVRRFRNFIFKKSVEMETTNMTSLSTFLVFIRTLNKYVIKYIFRILTMPILLIMHSHYINSGRKGTLIMFFAKNIK